MKKEVTYYLEDTSRLSEISQSELDAWIAEMPFHQPLQMLASIKSEMDGHSTDNNPKVYSAYFAEDFETIAAKSDKKKKTQSRKSAAPAKTIGILPEVASETALLPSEEEVSIDANEEKPLVEQAQEEIEVIEEVAEIHDINIGREVSSDLANELLEEEIMKHEVAEDINAIAAKGEVTSELANELLEEEIIAEVLEEQINIEAPIIAEHDSNDKAEEIQAERIIDEEVDQESSVEDISMDSESQQTEVTVLDQEISTSEVDYKEYLELGTEEINEVEDEDLVEFEDEVGEIISVEEDGEIASEVQAPEAEESGMAKNESKGKKKKKKKKDKEEKKAKKKEDKKEKDPKETKNSKKKKKDKTKDKSNFDKVKDPKINSKKGKKKKKRKSKKGSVKVEYVIVDAKEDKSFKLNDYDGVSNYTNWLLQQESINDGNELSKMVTNEEVKKSKKKKAKKKKKSKTLKIAVDSIKKQDSIISEPLANILAIQGHKKKARKMYTKLALVFPEKKEYFEEKIESLKK